jgi:hypothetical protein
VPGATYGLAPRLGLAGEAEPEDVGLVAGDGEATTAGDPFGPRLHLAGVDLLHPAAAFADQVVMVEGVAEPVQRLAAVPPEDIDLAAVDQALERPVDGRKADPPAQLRMEVLGGEGLGGLAQSRKHGAALPGGPRLTGGGC